MDHASRLLVAAFAMSLTLHGVLLSLQFNFPPKQDFKAEQRLDIILVNSKSKTKPVKAQAIAQANLEGGGNTDQERRAKSPLPVSETDEAGNALIEAHRRVKTLEEQQTKMMASVKSKKAIDPKIDKQDSKPEVKVEGFDLAEAAKAMARMEAQIAKQIEEYNSRPRRTNISPRTRESSLAFYYSQWREKVERVGALNYPEEAKGKIYGSLVLTVWILADGTVEKVEIDRSSGYQVLDQAALRIVRLASPFAKLTPEILKTTDILSITSTWTFAPGDQLFSE